ncbi:hypothetical protein V9T40_013517 [Parthenolecanium corni]|uniref:Uncharacterized protein n=1 Tax=Parthenolecanium corni TaxID=536013 RepID=A0AAN9TGK3_9HEMI
MAVDPRRRPLARARARRDARERRPRRRRRERRCSRGPPGYDRSAKLGGFTEAGRRTSHCRPSAAARERRRNAERGRSFERQGAVKSRLRFCTTRTEPPRSSEPILIPKLRIDFVDFPYLHYSMRLEAAHLGDLLRISVRTGAKTARGPLLIFTVRVGITDTAAASGALRARVPDLPASGFQGRTTLTEKRELFPDPPAASPGSFRLPGRGTRQRDARNADAARLRAPNTRERFRRRVPEYGPDSLSPDVR